MDFLPKVNKRAARLLGTSEWTVKIQNLHKQGQWIVLKFGYAVY